MIIYLINIFLILFFGYFLLYKFKNEKNKKIYCIIIAIQWILISGLRDWTVGVDTFSYFELFQMTKGYSWKYLLSNCVDYLQNDFGEYNDPGYFLFTKIFQIFSKDYQFFLVFIAIIFMSLMARWIYINSSMPEISFLIFSTLFYSFFAVTGHRQTLATALIFFLGYELAKEKKWFRFAIIAFLAFMLHKSSLVFIIYFVIANIELKPLYISSVSVITVIVVLLGKQLYAPIASAMGFSDEQIDYASGGAGTYATMLLLLCLLAFLSYKYISIRRDDSNNIYNMLFLTIATTLLVYQNQSFMRIQQYFSLIIMIIVPELILSVDKKYRAFIYVSVVGILIAYLIINNPQYKFFFA